MKIKTFYRNRLPHLAPVGGTFFVTFRLANSIPQPVIRKLIQERERALKDISTKNNKVYLQKLSKLHQKFFKAYDDHLDHNSKEKCYLSSPNIAKMIAQKLHEYDGSYYDLQAFCIMPNHVHLLIDTSIQLSNKAEICLDEEPEKYIQLHQIMKKIKGGTAYEANKFLKRTGQFWQKDSYDRLIRDEKEWCNTVDYILNNPVKAKLVTNWEDWEYSFYKYS